MLAGLQQMGLRMGIVTDGAVAVQDPKIDLLGIRRLMDVVVVSEAAGLSKPDPRILAIALHRLSIEPSEAWYVGDHPINDVLGAASAGLTPVWLSGIHPWPAVRDRPGLEIAELRGLVPLIVGLAARERSGGS